MSKFVFVIFSQFLLLLLQLLLGNGGWVLPLAMLGALCIVLAMGRNWGVFAGLLNGAVLAAIYGSSWNLLYIIIDPLLALFVNWWIEHHDEDIRSDFLLPGVLAGTAGGLPAVAAAFYGWLNSGVYPDMLHWLLLKMVWSAVVSAMLFNVMLLLNEALAEYLGLPRFLTRKSGQKR